MDAKRLVMGIMVAIFAVLASSAAHAMCRALKPGERYYASWSHCCDIAGGKSRWTKRSSGKTSVHSRTCRSWLGNTYGGSGSSRSSSGCIRLEMVTTRAYCAKVCRRAGRVNCRRYVRYNRRTRVCKYVEGRC